MGERRLGAEAMENFGVSFNAHKLLAWHRCILALKKTAVIWIVSNLITRMSHAT